MRRIIITLLLVGIGVQTYSQQDTYEIDSSDEIVGCSGVLLDSAGPNGTYDPDENHSVTICPDDVDSAIGLYCSLFDLGDGDLIRIYDGDSNFSPLIGTYTGNDLENEVLLAGEDNDSGCLTIVFESDAEDEGDFAISFSCAFECLPPPISVITVDEEYEPLQICQGEEVEFLAGESIPGSGGEIVSYTWYSDNNADPVFGGETITMSYEEPGIYFAQVDLIDADGCLNLNKADFRIEVSTTPDFFSESQLYYACLGEEVEIGSTVTPVEFDGIPIVDLGGELFIPDIPGTCFTSEIALSSFPGAFIDEATDIDNLFINFEHSFMSDLTLSLICPNGQSLLLHNQEGGGTYLGEPVDVEDTPELQGVGYDYFWASDATNGTWAEESGGTLASDTYSTVGDWEDLNGCPLNGTWQLEICDLVGVDNGYIFNWALNVNEENFPPNSSFTPSFGQGCDSTAWLEGPFISDQTIECDTIYVAPQELGTFEYIYEATDNFGCTYTNTVNVEVYQVEPALGEYAYCDDPITFQTSASSPDPNVSFEYVWGPEDFTDGATGSSWTYPNEIENGQEINVSVNVAGNPECMGSASTIISAPVLPVAEEPIEMELCFGETTNLNPPVQAPGSEFNYLWNFLNDVDTAVFETISIEPGISIQSGGFYTLEIIDAECNNSVTQEYLVISIPCEIEAPNVITPFNPDNLNDSFVIKGVHLFPGSRLVVYNRWGNIVYENDNYGKNGYWLPREEEVSAGTYFWVLELNTTTIQEKYNGTVTILE